MTGEEAPDALLRAATAMMAWAAGAAASFGLATIEPTGLGTAAFVASGASCAALSTGAYVRAARAAGAWTS